MITNFKLFENLNSDLYPKVLSNDIKYIKNYIKNGGDINFLFINNETLLTTAVIYGFEEMVDFLIENGADLNTQDYRKKTLINRLCSSELINNSEIMIQKLIDAGANLNIVDNYGSSALIIAAINDDFKIIEMLIETDWNIKNKNNKDFLQLVLYKYKNNIIKIYPEKYQTYLMNKTLDNFNI